LLRREGTFADCRIRWALEKHTLLVAFGSCPMKDKTLAGVLSELRNRLVSLRPLIVLAFFVMICAGVNAVDADVDVSGQAALGVGNLTPQMKFDPVTLDLGALFSQIVLGGVAACDVDDDGVIEILLNFRRAESETICREEGISRIESLLCLGDGAFLAAGNGQDNYGRNGSPRYVHSTATGPHKPAPKGHSINLQQNLWWAEFPTITG
jgi:hypothetical protein